MKIEKKKNFFNWIDIVDFFCRPSFRQTYTNQLTSTTSILKCKNLLICPEHSNLRCIFPFLIQKSTKEKRRRLFQNVPVYDEKKLFYNGKLEEKINHRHSKRNVFLIVNVMRSVKRDVKSQYLFFCLRQILLVYVLRNI